MYATVEEVYRATSLDKTIVNEEAVNDFILAAQTKVDRLTNTTYWVLIDEGDVTSATNDSLVNDTKNYDKNGLRGYYIETYLSGKVDIRRIKSNTPTSIVVDREWSVTPTSSYSYKIYYTNRSSYVNEVRGAAPNALLYVYRYPLRHVEQIIIDDVEVDVATTIINYPIGKIRLGETSQVTRWNSSFADKNEINYFYGVEIPAEIKRLTIVYASIMTLEAQMGATHNIPSTYSLPEGSVTIGQAYINIEGTIRRFIDEKNSLEETVIKYVSVA